MTSQISLSEHFSYTKLLRFTIPSIGGMLFTSAYYIVDGYFVSNYVGATAFAAVNLIMPFLMVLAAVGFMVGTGGSALVSMTLGMGDHKKANEIFSMLTYFLIGFGVISAVCGALLMPAVARGFGATGRMLALCVRYGRINMISLPMYLLLNHFQSFLVTAERPRMGFYVTVATGLVNMALDFWLIGVLGFGVEGAAAATVSSECVGGGVPLLFFIFAKHTPLRLGRTHFDGRAMWRAMTNGASEFLTEISASFVAMLFNFQLMRIAGENGVAAYGVLAYVMFIFTSIFFGYDIGVSPVIGYHYGAANDKELKGLYHKSIVLTLGAAIVLFAAAESMAGAFAKLFVGYDAALYVMTVEAFRIGAWRFLFIGYNAFGSAFFTALNNGKLSLFLSFMRLLVLQVLFIMLLPPFFGLYGIWLAMVLPEVGAAILTFIVFRRHLPFQR